MEETRQRKKSLSPKLWLKRLTVNLPEELAEKVKERAKQENKSISLLLTEIVEDYFKKEKENG